MPADPWRLYDLLLDSVPAEADLGAVTLGLTWTLARVESRGESGSESGPESAPEYALGLAMSPELPSRTLTWAGTLAGRSARDVAAWVKSWEPHPAAVGMATLNALVNSGNELAASATPLYPQGPANLAVFEYFRAQLRGQRVVVIGRYPGLERLQDELALTVIERNPRGDDRPDPAAEYLLPEADWVFITASSLTNKTFPRLAELAGDARVVLMGPTTPWCAGLREFGVDYLAGVCVRDPLALQTTVAEGGGTRIFETGVQYALVDLHQDEAARLKSAIAAVFARRAALKAEMEGWYARGKRRFPGADQLLRIDAQLSNLDRRFKQVWDAGRAADRQRNTG